MIKLFFIGKEKLTKKEDVGYIKKKQKKKKQIVFCLAKM